PISKRRLFCFFVFLSLNDSKQNLNSYSSIIELVENFDDKNKTSHLTLKTTKYRRSLQPTVVAKLETETQPAWVVPHRCFHNSSTGTLLLNSSSLLIYFLRERSSTMYPSMVSLL
ncbi:hypothetical protein LOAG_12204, partial [Loa loa]